MLVEPPDFQRGTVRLHVFGGLRSTLPVPRSTYLRETISRTCRKTIQSIFSGDPAQMAVFWHLTNKLCSRMKWEILWKRQNLGMEVLVISPPRYAVSVQFDILRMSCSFSKPDNEFPAIPPPWTSPSPAPVIVSGWIIIFPFEIVGTRYCFIIFRSNVNAVHFPSKI